MPVELLDRSVATVPLDSETTVEWLVDNAKAYGAILRAMAGARQSIWISQLAFDADCIAYGESPGHDTRLLDTIVSATRRTHLDVRILLNESLLLDTATALRAALARENASDIEVRGISRFPQLLHAKLLIVDGREAFVLGSPFVNGYWDDDQHRPVDARRPMRELGGRPLHDLSMRVTGAVVRSLGDMFAELWDDVAERTAGTSVRRRGHTAPSATEAVRAISTVPPGVLPRQPEGRTEILAAMERGIGRARSLLYIEHQYLSSRAVIRALVAALVRSPALEVIVVLNQNPDVTAYRGWQNARLAEAKLRSHPRVGFFALWSAERLDNDVVALNQVFVHSKVIIADDEWATVGSANVDGVSLHSYGNDFESRLGQRVFRDVRNFDVNLELSENGGATDGSIGELRRLLWSEHLGEDVDVESRPDDGWLPLWHARAAANVALLNSGEACNHFRAPRSFVLPYSSASTPSGQLESLGVHRDTIDLRFKPSWLEVHCSPNWIRNMFA
ncbi:MAG: phospholipase D-like domain-containing protein [Gemmatimonadaceae bacterium]